MSNYHRITWIDARIRAKTYPNCRIIAEKFEISTRQASRDIEYLRYSMGAPIAYSSQRNGYYYTNETYILPAHLLTNEEKQTLTYLAHQYKNMGDSQALRLAEFFSRLTGEGSLEKGLRSFPILQVDSREIDVFYKLKIAMEERCQVELDYVNAQNKCSQRVFCPYKLFTKRNIQYVVGYCEQKKEIRVFRISRIKNIRLTKVGFTVSPLFFSDDYGQNIPFQMKDPFIAQVRFDQPIDSQVFKLISRPIRDLVLEIEFFQSQDILSALLSLPREFVILSPNWLKEKLRKKLQKLLTDLN